MPLTPADVHNVAFSKPPIGKRGYNEDEVDQFLDLVEDALSELQDENTELRNRAEDLEGQLAAGGNRIAVPLGAPSAVDESRLRSEIEQQLRAEFNDTLAGRQRDIERSYQARLADAERRASEAEAAKRAALAEQPKAAAVVSPAQEASANATRVLELAQETAERLKGDADTEAKKLIAEARENAKRALADARFEADATLADAKRRSEQMVEDARNESESALADARHRSDQMISDADARSNATISSAQEKAAALQADAERKHREIMTTVKEQQAALEGRIEELRIFEREYRTRLKTFLESQLDDLNSRESAAPADGYNN